MTDVQFEECRSQDAGGSLWNGGTCLWSGGFVKRSWASLVGGGVYTSGYMSASTVEILASHAQLGGGVFVSQGGEAVLQNVRVGSSLFADRESRVSIRGSDIVLEGRSSFVVNGGHVTMTSTRAHTNSSSTVLCVWEGGTFEADNEWAGFRHFLQDCGSSITMDSLAAVRVGEKGEEVGENGTYQQPNAVLECDWGRAGHWSGHCSGTALPSPNRRLLSCAQRPRTQDSPDINRRTLNGVFVVIGLIVAGWMVWIRAGGRTRRLRSLGKHPLARRRGHVGNPPKGTKQQSTQGVLKHSSVHRVVSRTI